jgi:phosphohistidine phosphatase
MKTLFLMRHAKSSWDNPELADFDRPLNQRGLKAAAFMGKLMKERGIEPDLILSSPARRAAHTAQIVKREGQFLAEISYDEKIYEASPLTLLYLLKRVDNAVNSLLLIGHNPGFESLLKLLTSETRSMPTAALAKITMLIENWSDINEHCGKLEFLIKPKEEMR